MAEKRTLARPYAVAAFRAAREHERLGDWLQALQVAASVVATRDAAAALSAPGLSRERRVALLLNIVGALDAAAGELFNEGRGHNFLRLLAENGRLALLPEIAELFDELRAEEQRTVDVEVVSAIALDDQTRERLTESLAQRLGREVRLDCSVDDALLGGAIIRADDLVIDGSLRTRLGKLAAALTR